MNWKLVNRMIEMLETCVGVNPPYPGLSVPCVHCHTMRDAATVVCIPDKPFQYACRDCHINAIRTAIGLASQSDTYTTSEATKEFEFEGFSHGYAIVRRRSDSVRGSLAFVHSPRIYYGFVAASEEHQ